MCIADTPAVEGMHSVGYVHRDISCGNVLLVERNTLTPSSPERVGVLTDLEYAVHLESTSDAHDIRIGTPFFWACEVAANEYLAWPGPMAQGVVFRYNSLHGKRTLLAPEVLQLLRQNPIGRP